MISKTTFQRSPHDKENPFAQISRDLLRDNSISPECRWLISYLLCNKEGWVIKIEQIVNHLKGHRNCGQRRIYKLVNEAIAAGYMQRQTFHEKNLKRYRYLVSESRSFSNNFSDMALPDVSANDTVKEEHIEEYKSKPKDEHSADASALASYFLSKVKEKKPNFTKSVSPSWLKSSDKILKIRSKQEIGKIIDFAMNHDFWMSKCLSPEKLLKHLDALEMEMAKPKGSKFKPNENQIEKNKNLIQHIIHTFPQRTLMKGGNIDVGNNDITFVYGPNSDVIKIDDPLFEERVLGNLKRMKLSIML